MIYDLIYMYYAKVLTSFSKGTGMIYLEGNESTEYNNGDWIYNGVTYKYNIKERDRLFVLTTMISDTFWKGVKKSKYIYDLNNWLTKYGKPTEFSIAVHAATLAPDFAYELATNNAVDTKVHISVLPVDIKIKFVPEMNSDESVLEYIEEANNDVELRQKIVNLIMSDYVYGNHGDGNTIKEKIEKKDWNYFSNNIREEVQKYDDIDKAVQFVLQNDYQRSYYSINSILTKVENIFNIDTILDSEDDFLELWFTYDKSDCFYEDCTISSLGINNSHYEKFEDIPLGLLFEEDGIRDKIKQWEDEVTKTAIPYITKVEHHWFRNQYFTGIQYDSDEEYAYVAKVRLEELIDKIDNKIQLNNTQTSIFILDKIDLKDNNAIAQYLESFESYIDDLSIDDELKEYCLSEIKATEKEFETGIITGGAYKVIGNPDPEWHPLDNEELSAAINDNPDYAEFADFLTRLAIKETRNTDLKQIYNPLFEDNSRFIRNWLKEKYFIFPGQTDNNQSIDEGNGNTTGIALTDQIIVAGKQYINGNHALEAIEAELENCDSRSTDIAYMLRDMKQLLEDFDFDMENQEIPAEKVLYNVMPDYKPYTAWPSVNKKTERDCTKMIFKTNTSGHALISPSKGKIARIGEDYIEIEFSDDASFLNVEARMTLRIVVESGTLENVVNLDVNSDVLSRDLIGRVSPENGVIILKLYLFSVTKQILRVEDYMTVDKWTYDEMKEDSTQNEYLKILYNLLASEFNDPNETDEARVSEYIATLNTVFNTLNCPYLRNNNTTSTSIYLDSRNDSNHM